MCNKNVLSNRSVYNWKRSIIKVGLRARLCRVIGNTPITGLTRDEPLSGRTEISTEVSIYRHEL